MCIMEEMAFQIWTLKFLTFVFNLSIMLKVLSIELKTNRKNDNKFERRLKAKQWRF